MGFAGSIADMAIYDRYGDAVAVDVYNEAFESGRDDALDFAMCGGESGGGEDVQAVEHDGYAEMIEQAQIDGYDEGVTSMFTELNWDGSEVRDAFTDWALSRGGSTAMTPINNDDDFDPSEPLILG